MLYSQAWAVYDQLQLIGITAELRVSTEAWLGHCQWSSTHSPSQLSQPSQQSHANSTLENEVAKSLSPASAHTLLHSHPVSNINSSNSDSDSSSRNNSSTKQSPSSTTNSSTPPPRPTLFPSSSRNTKTPALIRPRPPLPTNSHTTHLSQPTQPTTTNPRSLSNTQPLPSTNQSSLHSKLHACVTHTTRTPLLPSPAPSLLSLLSSNAAAMQKGLVLLQTDKSSVHSEAGPQTANTNTAPPTFAQQRSTHSPIQVAALLQLLHAHAVMRTPVSSELLGDACRCVCCDL